MVGGHAACSNLSFATGITSNPQHRFFNGTYGYCRVDELYGDMIVLAKGEPHLIVALEQRLIGVFKGGQAAAMWRQAASPLPLRTHLSVMLSGDSSVMAGRSPCRPSTQRPVACCLICASGC